MTKFAGSYLQNGFYRSCALDLLADDIQHAFAFGLFLRPLELAAVLQHGGDLGGKRREQAGLILGEDMGFFGCQYQHTKWARP